MNSHSDTDFMVAAIQCAEKAAEAGEVPVGAVVVMDGVIIGEGWNRVIADHDPTAHAEVIALRAAAKKLGNYRLNGCTLYVTLEPCAMCAGSITNARIKRVVFGALDKKAGAAGSIVQLLRHPQMPHLCEMTSGVLSDQAQSMLTNFFERKRKVKGK